MARKKQYIESEVINKAMHLFWRNGYETTSMQMLEKEMGINKFSIYASFGSKNGVFLESLKAYKNHLSSLIEKLKNTKNGVEGIKQYFKDFIIFSNADGIAKGCLVTNATNEIRACADQKILDTLHNFTQEVRDVFADKLREDKNKTEAEIQQQADYLIIAMLGFSSATRIFNNQQLNNYLKNIFKHI